MIRAVLLDMDGTILDTEEFITWSFTEASRIVGVGVDAGLVRRSIGRPLDEFHQLVFKGLSRDKYMELMRVRSRIVEENWRRMIRVFEDAPPALAGLKARGFKLAVASSSRVERILEYLSYFKLIDFFDAVSGVTDGVRGKPQPDVVVNALSKLGVRPGEAVYVGDREVDCQASHAAGVPFILVNRNGYDYDYASCRPDHSVETLETLIDLVLYINKTKIVQ